MKITDLKTYVVGNPPPHFGGRYFIFLKLTTDSGIEGIGEVYAATFGPHTIARMVEDVCQRHVIGADPFKIEALWRNFYGRGAIRCAPMSRWWACSAASRWPAGTSSARS